MSIHRNTLLAGIAALPLIAGAGIAAAQDKPEQNKAPQATPQATQQMKMNKGQAAGQMDRSAQEQKEAPDGAAKTDHTAQGEKTGAKTAAEPPRGTHKHAAIREQTNRGTTAQQSPQRGPNTAQQERSGPATAAERPRNGLEGLQGNAAGGNVQFSQEQRTQIRNTVLNAPNAPRAGNVDFNVAVGTIVPRGSVNIVAVPPTLVQIEPEWRGFRYFVWNDQLIIVNPRDMRIVAVVNV